MRIRINNIGAETNTGATSMVGGEKSVSICRFHPNRYYGMLGEYLSSGWEDCGSHIRSEKGGVNIDKGCFSAKENSYVIAFVSSGRRGESSRLESVEDRLLYLDREDRDDFFEVYRLVDQRLARENPLADSEKAGN